MHSRGWRSGTSFKHLRLLKESITSSEVGLFGSMAATNRESMKVVQISDEAPTELDSTVQMHLTKMHDLGEEGQSHDCEPGRLDLDKRSALCPRQYCHFTFLPEPFSLSRSPSLATNFISRDQQ